MDVLEAEEQDTSELVVEFEVVNAVFEDEAADKEGFANVVGVEVGQNEAELGGKDKAEVEGRLDPGHLGDSSDHVAVQQAEAAVVVGELASEIVGPKEPEHVKAVETILVPEAVLEVEAAVGVGPVAEAGIVAVAEAGVAVAVVAEAGHRPAGIVELQTVDRGSTVDTAVGKDLVQGIAGSTVDIVAADTIALLLAAQQLELKLEFEKLGWLADLKHAQV